MDVCIDHGHKASRYSVGWMDGKRAGLHRIVYCKHHGVSLDSLKGCVIMHECDNDRCINPLHLTKGTQSENIKTPSNVAVRSATQGMPTRIQRPLKHSGLRY